MGACGVAFVDVAVVWAVVPMFEFADDSSGVDGDDRARGAGVHALTRFRSGLPSSLR